MTEDNRVDTIRAAVAALNNGDVDGYLQHFDPSCKRWIVGLEQPLTLAQIRASLGNLRDAFEGLYLNEDLLFGNGQFVCARWRLSGTHVKDYLGFPPKRTEVNVQTCEVYEFNGGRVVETWAYGDPGQMSRQIGATPRSRHSQ